MQCGDKEKDYVLKCGEFSILTPGYVGTFFPLDTVQEQDWQNW